MGTAEAYSGDGAQEYRASAEDENVELKFCWWPCGYEEDARRPQCHKKQHLMTGLIKVGYLRDTWVKLYATLYPWADSHAFCTKTE